MDSKCKAQLLNARSYAEAKPILETLKISASGDELARTAYQIRETQPSVAEHFLRTVIREADDVEVKEHKTDDKSGVKETDDNTDSQSTSTTGLEKIGSEDAPSTSKTSTDQKDQMGVAINEAFPPQGGMPPAPMAAPPAAAPPAAPQQENGLPPAGGMPPAPAAAPPMAPQQMMRYTISETMKIINPQLKKIAEAIMAIDKKVQETEMSRVTSLELGSKMGQPISKPQLIRETTGNISTDVSRTRHDIKQFNDAINQGYIQ